MSSLVEVLYPLPDVRRTPLSLLRWWEARRPLYNVVVGATGLFTLTMVVGLNLLWPGDGSGLQILPVLAASAAYGIAANVCFSLGWVAEVLARLAWGDQAPRMGPLLFRQGLIFSVGLTLLPAGITTVAWMIAAVLGLVAG